MYLEADLGWVGCAPACGSHESAIRLEGLRAGAWRAVAIDADAVHRAVRRIKVLPGRFPVALPRVVGDVEVWSARHLALIEVLKAEEPEQAIVFCRTKIGTARLDRALANSTTAMVLFAPAVLILGQLGAFSAATLTAAQVFLVARVLYVPAYALGLTGIRSAIWLAGFAATIVLYLIALMAA